MSDSQYQWPQDWQSLPIDRVASQITSGGTPTSGSPRYYADHGGLPFAKTEDLTRSQTKFIEDCDLQITDAALKESAAKIYPAGTVLVSMYGTIGLTKITVRKMAGNQALCALIPPFACDCNYLYHHLDFIRPDWARFSGQTTQANINGAVVRARKVPIPPRDEQRNIARVLDTLDTAIRETEVLIAKLKLIKQGLLHDLLTRGIDKNGKLRPPRSEAPHLYKDSPLGWIPRDWDCHSFGDLADYSNGNSFDAARWAESGMPIIRIQNLNGSLAFNYYEGSVQEKWHIRPGDLLFAWSGQRGVSFGARIWGGPEGVLNQHIFKVLPNTTVVSKAFLYRLLRFRQSAIEEAAHGFKDSFLHVTRGELSSVMVAVPDDHEQHDIEERISAHEETHENEESELKKLLDLKRGLMDDLLTGRVRVTPLLEREKQQA
ncbi:restriction endonuclease subunit S [Burkholderia seminalis]|uniref:restriction endonuclease subunit S n=1 Tax=Burkholderia seminalis TaxID=488731 RepID=UPI000F5A92B6|nr:restriction endonuclease subunit S [Burkholderia seminalis]RQS94613.1 restriction endonuclease subunit S [Burkholderia seminalis]